MKKDPRITDAEWQVMKILWEKAPITSLALVEILQSRIGWKPTTVYTLVSRLVTKKAVMVDKSSSPYVCTPLLSEQECRRAERNSFLQKAYDGSLSMLVVNLLEENELSANEIEHLKRVLANKKGKER
ncbi:penicillinase repressor [Peptococcaceae bacterium CEB3]|nr:penicillinase repressor [Peptococcaceae bacterium CEB3]